MPLSFSGLYGQETATKLNFSVSMPGGLRLRKRKISGLPLSSPFATAHPPSDSELSAFVIEFPPVQPAMAIEITTIDRGCRFMRSLRLPIGSNKQFVRPILA